MKKFYFCKLCLIVFGYLLVVQNARAVSPEDFDRVFGTNLQGWDGVLFSCDFQRENELVLNICRESEAHFAFVAESLGVAYKVGKTGDYVANTLFASDNRYIQMELDLMTLGSSQAVYGNLAYSLFIEQPARGNRTPIRRGTIRILEQPILAAGGSPAELSLSVAQSLEAPIKTMLVAYKRNSAN